MAVMSDPSSPPENYAFLHCFNNLGSSDVCGRDQAHEDLFVGASFRARFSYLRTSDTDVDLDRG